MDTRQRTVLVYPVVYPNFFTHVTPPTWATPGGYVYIYRPLHRLGSDNGNHYQLPSLAFAWVTDMPTCNASQTCRVWRLQSL